MQMGETSCAVSLRLKPPPAANYCPPIQKYILHIAACIKPDPPPRPTAGTAFSALPRSRSFPPDKRSWIATRPRELAGASSNVSDLEP